MRHRPSVYFVDSHTGPPPLPPRAGRNRRCSSLAQTLLFVLVSVALSGLVVEALLIFYLHSIARLMGAKDVGHGKGIVGWNRISDHLLRGMDYKDGSLLIRREGFYFVYCKLSFHSHRVFHHTVEMHTRRHSAGPVVLLQARKYSSADGNISNSFLGGVFHLHKDDALFVKVRDTSKIVQVIAYESIFGAFMI